MKGSHTKHILLAALMGLAALPLCFAPPLLLLLPGFFGFIVMAWGPACLGAAVGASALSVFLVSGASDFTTALLLLSLYLPASLVLCYCLIRRRSWRSAALGGSLAMALGLYALLCLPSLLSGNGPFGDFENTFRLLGEQLATAVPQLGAPEALVDQIKNYSAYLQLSAPSLVTGTIVGMAMFFGFFAPLIARGLCKAAGVETRPMARFENWQLGRSFMQGLVVLLIGALIGWVNGIVITKFSVAPFIATLGMMYIARGFANLRSNGATFSDITGKQGLGNTGFTFFGSNTFGIPNGAILFVIIAAIAAVALKKTSFGWHILAVGGNQRAARLSGVKVNRVTIIVYVVSGICAAIVGIID